MAAVASDTPKPGPRDSHRLPAARVGADAPWLDIVKGASLLLPKDAAFSHQTALRIYGIDFGDKRPLHVSVPLGASRGSRGLVRWHRSDLANQRIKVAGVIVTTPWKTGATWEQSSASHCW